VRAVAYAACVLLVALAAAGCGGSGTSVELVWGGPPQPGAGGVVPTDGFASFQQGVDEAWEHSPATAAAEFLRLDERKAARVIVEARSASGEGTGPATVVVTLDGLPDDSIRSERWTLGFGEADGVYTLSSALHEQRCRPGRGHAAFTPGPCV
jgi:hypothetical protein